jgi:transcriptional regulator GlxA family with amidase domain
MMRRYIYCFFLITLLFSSSAIAQQKVESKPITVGILVLNKPYITEFAGPLDVYHHVPTDKLKVFMISDTDKEQVTYEGMPFRANYTITNAPRIDVLVIPSGAGSLTDDPKNTRVINWIKEVARDAKFVTSHCEGAFLLGAAGLLDNKTATTFHSDIPALEKRYPSCRVQKDRRIVVDGNLITSAGGLASYEAALYVVEKLFGKEQAATVAKALVFGPSNTEAASTVR